MNSKRSKQQDHEICQLNQLDLWSMYFDLFWYRFSFHSVVEVGWYSDMVAEDIKEASVSDQGGRPLSEGPKKVKKLPCHFW